MCNVCAGLTALRETLDYNRGSENFFILALGENAEGKAKVQIRKDGFFFKDKWIYVENLAFFMGEIGSDIKEKSRTDTMNKKFDEYLSVFY
ncbi:MAG: hypothetical protein ABIG64_07725 [Candidatus Omnitrophota bacterium]